MAKRPKHSDRNKRSRGTSDLGRRKPTLNPRCRILIVCEGSKTEPGYFGELKKKYRPYTSAVDIVGEGRGSDPKSVVNCAIKKKNIPNTEYDHVWCVIDVEARNNARNLNQALQAANHNNIIVALSNPCFEVWLLYHFEPVGRAFNDCRDVIHTLKNHISSYTKSRNYFSKYFSNNVNNAIGNAKSIMITHQRNHTSRLLRNPSTEVNLLVQLIIDNAHS